MFTLRKKQETVQHLDDEERPHCMDATFCNDYMNADLSQVVERQEFKQENSEGSLSLTKNEEIDDVQYPVIVKIESLEEHRVLDNFGDSGVHYDVLVAPQQVQCRLCDRTFKNRFILLKHNNEHIKVVMYPTQVDIEMNKIHKCKCCDEYFNSHDNMLAHFRNLHSNKRHKSESYHGGIKPYLTSNNGEKIEYKCDLCDRLYKSKKALLVHTRKIHIDYGRMFECWCGKQFRTPVHLSTHKCATHSNRVLNKRNDKFQCDSCHKMFKLKTHLTRHIKQIHYDYGKTFECWCGKQFPTPFYLAEHKKGHCDEVQCDYCNKKFKTKYILAHHIERLHYDYGKTFQCSCGKQFRTPIHLSLHKKWKLRPKVKIINKEQFKCDSCHKFFKTRRRLMCHKKMMHYDYGKTFECWCGKEFRTPLHLADHKKVHCDLALPCDYCDKIFKNKCLLASHIKRMHYDYGKTFECLCGKQFRTPYHLSRHKRLLHNALNNQQFQCDSCHKFFDTKKNLSNHIKKMHYNYRKSFECWCGKQFRKPTYLSEHQKQVHCADVKNINDERFQCHICPKLLKTKRCLAEHIKNVHYDYGKTFECWCGKQFRTPKRLRVHEYMRHGKAVRTVTNFNVTLAGKFSKTNVN